ncbi:hypothetical protein [Caldivirga sp.]|uniref:hypothetical protein n=1 Tax=Caldivirga sp. TaxID=2080243 RepID=UPI0025C6305E|nr:hypothetical protein [Caldivirga sp.]
MFNEVVLSIIGLAVTVVGMLGGSLYWLGGKFKEIDKGFEKVDRRFDEMDRKLTIFADSVRSAAVAMNSAIIEFLGVKGLISPSEAAFLTNEVARIS